MSRGRHSRRSLSAEEKKQLKEKHSVLCAKDKHIWRPTFVSLHLGDTPRWHRGAVHCEYCNMESTFRKLTKAERELVTNIAKVLTDVNERVASLHGTRTFTNSGI